MRGNPGCFGSTGLRVPPRALDSIAILDADSHTPPNPSDSQPLQSPSKTPLVIHYAPKCFALQLCTLPFGHEGRVFPYRRGALASDPKGSGVSEEWLEGIRTFMRSF